MGKSYLQGEVLTAADLNASLAEAVNTTGYFVFTGEHVYQALLTANNGFIVNTTPSNFYSSTNFYNNITVHSGNYVLSTGNFTATQGNITASQGNITATNGIMTDRIGNLRRVPLNAVGNGYTLVALDSGKVVYNGSGGTMNIPNNVFTGGDTITIYNSGAAFTIVQNAGLSLYWAGQPSVTTGNRVLSTAGLCTVLFINASYAVISGAGLT